MGGDITQYIGDTMQNQRALIIKEGIRGYPALEKLLIQRGIVPARAYDAMEALAETERRQYSYYFIDVNLPESSGFEVAERIKTIQPDAVIIFMYHSSGNNLKAAEMSSLNYLKKPYDLDQFLLFIRESLEKKRYLVEIESLRRQLQESEYKYRRLVENIPAVVYRIRPDLSFSFINDYCWEIFDISPEQIIDGNHFWNRYIHPEDREILIEKLRDCFNKGKPFTYEHRVICKCGAIRYVINRCLPIRGKDRAIKEVDGIFIEKTMAKQIKQRLVHTEKMKALGEISASIAHEIHKPLVCIGGMAKMLMEKLPRNYSNLNKLRIISDEVTRLENLLQKVLNYIKPQRTSPSVSDVNQILRDVLCLFEFQMEKNNIIIKEKLDKRGCAAYIDPESMKQVLTNLILNSIKAMSQGGVLTLETIKGPKTNRIIIEGNGTGIPEEISQTILNSLVSYNTHGTSLELSISKQIVQSFGGSLSFETERGKGTKFIVSIPPKP